MAKKSGFQCDMDEIKKQVQNLLKDKGWTTRNLSEETGISDYMLDAWLYGKAKLKMGQVQAIFRALDADSPITKYLENRTKTTPMAYTYDGNQTVEDVLQNILHGIMFSAKEAARLIAIPASAMQDVLDGKRKFTVEEMERFLKNFPHAQLDAALDTLSDHAPDAKTRYKIGNHLSDIRQAAGLSQAELAFLTGTDIFHVSAAEYGIAMLDGDAHMRMLKALGIEKNENADSDEAIIRAQTYGERLRNFRQALKWSEEECAKKASLDVSVIREIEDGTVPSNDAKQKLEAVFGSSLACAETEKPKFSVPASPNESQNADHVGQMIRDMRSAASLSQNSVARKLGITRGDLNSLECGEYLPSDKFLSEIAAVLGVTVDHLNGNAADKKTEQEMEKESEAATDADLFEDPDMPENIPAEDRDSGAAEPEDGQEEELTEEQMEEQMDKQEDRQEEGPETDKPDEEAVDKKLVKKKYKADDCGWDLLDDGPDDTPMEDFTISGPKADAMFYLGTDPEIPIEDEEPERETGMDLCAVGSNDGLSQPEAMQVAGVLLSMLSDSGRAYAIEMLTKICVDRKNREGEAV